MAVVLILIVLIALLIGTYIPSSPRASAFEFSGQPSPVEDDAVLAALSDESAVAVAVGGAQARIRANRLTTASVFSQ